MSFESNLSWDAKIGRLPNKFMYVIHYRINGESIDISLKTVNSQSLQNNSN